MTAKTTTAKPKWSTFFIALFAALFVFSALFFGFVSYVQNQNTVGGDFELTYKDEPWKFSDHSKKLNLFYIGYAKCPDVCPMSLSVASDAFKELNARQKKNIQLIFLSVDHENDNPEEVAKYAQQFNPEFVGLSGSKEQIDQAVSLFHASYLLEKTPDTYLGYSISHTDRFFFLNSKGRVEAMIANPRSKDEVLNVIKETL